MDRRSRSPGQGGRGVLDERFGPYRLESLLGRGGMGEVYRAFDTVRQRLVALKRLPAELAADESFRSRFRRESALAATLRDPHVIPIHDYGEIDGRLYIDMRLVEGVDLASGLDRHGPVPPARAVDVVAQVASALDAAHAAGLVHRDVKPSNVLLTGTAALEFAYLIDFGIARSVLDSTLTGTGEAVGTIGYMAPERFAGGRGDRRVDVYALGCLLVAALTGSAPFTGDDLPALMYAHLNQPPPVPSTMRGGVPPALDAVVAAAMAKEPERRYPTARALAAAARAALAVGPAPRSRPAGEAAGAARPVAARHPGAAEPVGDGAGSVTVSGPCQASGRPGLTGQAGDGARSMAISGPPAVPGQPGTSAAGVPAASAPTGAAATRTARTRAAPPEARRRPPSKRVRRAWRPWGWSRRSPPSARCSSGRSRAMRWAVRRRRSRSPRTARRRTS
jgi:serine/threonine kinase PknH